MAIWIKLPPCFGSSKQTKYELIMETVLSRGPLWHNIHYVERKSNSEIIIGQDGQPLCQELEVSLCPPGGRLQYMPTGAGHLPPLTLAACHDTVFVSKSEFPGGPNGPGTRENPVNLSDAPTEALHTAMHPEGMEPIDEVAMLSHFSDALSEMAESLMDLKDGYFKALLEVIIEMERAQWDVSHIDAHYVSQVVTVMASWQELVQATATHMENANLTIYLAHQEDA